MHVAIVGAGPGGAALAFLLARRGVEVTLLERHTDFAREFRGEGLMPSGVDAFVQMGLRAQLDALPQSRLGGLEVYQGARRVIRLDLSDLPPDSGFPRFVSQPHMLEMLVAESEKFSCFRFERGFTVRNLARKGGRVCGVRGDAQGAPREITCDFVVGADGRASVLRKRAGLERAHEAPLFDVVWCKVPLPDFMADRSTGRAYLGRGHFCLMFPAPDGRLQIGWIIAKGAFGELRAQGVDRWVDELASFVSPELGAHLRARRSEITHPFLLDVVCYHLDEWTAPGLLLLGDAAHPMSPVGAQGINIALRDALVAGNQLGAALTGAPRVEELDAAARRVRDERLAEVREIQRLQQLPPRVLFQGSWLSRLLVGHVAPLLARTPLPRWALRSVFQRFAEGTTRVELQPH